MKLLRKIKILVTVLSLIIFAGSCNYITHSTFSGYNEEGEPEPDYNITLNDSYQDFVSYIFMGNRIDNFTTYFNAFYTAETDYNLAMQQIRTSTIAAYNRRLDSLNIVTNISPQTKDLLNKVVERASKVIQFSKSSRFIDKAVLLIGESYYYMQEYLQAERSLSEFLSQFNSSTVKDKATLYFARTKMRLGQDREAETLYKSLITNTKNNSIKSDASFDLGVYYLTQRNQTEAMQYLKSSVDFAQNSESRAEKQFLLARIYSRYEPNLSAAAFSRAIQLSSNFDLKFYSRLNYGKALITDKKFRQASVLLEDMASDYRDYPEFRQLVDLEIANNLLAQGLFDKAKIEYYNVIVDYPGTISASDSYFYLANYYENVQGDFLKALVNYKKSNQENANANYSEISRDKSRIFERYFELQGQAENTQKITIPMQNDELENYRLRRLQQRGIDVPRRDGIDNRGGLDGKGGGFSSKYLGITDDSTKVDSGDDGEDILDPRRIRGIEFEDSGDSKNPGDFIEERKTSSEENIGEVKTDNTKIIQKERFSALFQLAEIFMYELNYPDSAEYYLNVLIREETDYINLAKAYYAKALLLERVNRNQEAEEIFNKIINEFSNSQFAIESKKQLGLEVTETFSNIVDESFGTASGLILNKNYEEAVTELHKIISTNPDTTVLPRAYYTLGWIYENGLSNKDSALHYYNIIIGQYPFSVYNNSVYEKVTVLTQNDKTQESEEEKLPEENPEEMKEVKEEIPIEKQVETDGTPEKKSEETGNEEGEKLSEDELQRLLKELEQEGN